ncbi:MAG TPA: CHASE2 domain-containing protein, partial [Rhizomicrobium sp.]|nr:CHASE2 domain-containing protein [Rhizomicrobium sp.]
MSGATAEIGKRRRDRVLRVVQRARRPDRAQMEALSQRMPYWFVCVTLFAFAAIQIVLNPFGFSDLTQRYAQDISNLLVTGPYFYGDAGQKQISAAIIDEDTLQTLQMPWPWSYGAHARVLDSILEYRPKAVVVDFLFVDARNDPTLPQLIDEIHRYQKAHIPIYFEGGTQLPYGEHPLRPELAATGVPILDPTFPVYDGIARQYNVTGKCFGRAGSCYSLALEVFRGAYPQYKLEPLNGMMELVWGTRTDPHNGKWITATNEDGTKRSCASDIGPLRRFYLAFFDPSQVQNPCPYNAQLPVVALMEGSDDPDIPNLIQNRVVFYGGALEGAQDKTYTPVNGLLPSVYVHAMALDNLITFRGRPEQNVVTAFGYTIPSNPAQMLAIIPVILILAAMHMRRKRRKRAAGQEHSVTFEYVLDKTMET